MEIYKQFCDAVVYLGLLGLLIYGNLVVFQLVRDMIMLAIGWVQGRRG